MSRIGIVKCSWAWPFFGVRRFSAAFILSVFQKKQAKQSGGKAPHSKKRPSRVRGTAFPGRPAQRTAWEGRPTIKPRHIQVPKTQLFPKGNIVASKKQLRKGLETAPQVLVSRWLRAVAAKEKLTETYASYALDRREAGTLVQKLRSMR